MPADTLGQHDTHSLSKHQAMSQIEILCHAPFIHFQPALQGKWSAKACPKPPARTYGVVRNKASKALRPSTPADAGWIAELRAVVLRDDLTRLGRYDQTRVRQRFLDSFAAAATQVIVVDGADTGSIAVRREVDAWWIEHFYLDPAVQGLPSASHLTS